jgi:hypothetical protein
MPGKATAASRQASNERAFDFGLGLILDGLERLPGRE